MDKPHRPGGGDPDLLSIWFRGAADFWGGLLQNGPPRTSKADRARTLSADSAPQEIRSSFESLLQAWQTVADCLGRIQRDSVLAWTRMFEASFSLLHGLDTSHSPTPHEVVFEKDRVRLMHYRKTAAKEGPRHPLLLVYSLINRNSILDLQADRSLVQHLLSRGIDLYMIDWGSPGREDCRLSIDDHVNGYLDAMIDFIRAKHTLQKINLMGICLGGTLGVIYAALHPQKVKNLIPTVTPTFFDIQEDPLHSWMRGMDVDAIIATFGNMPGSFLVNGLLLLTPVRLLIEKYAKLGRNLQDKRYVETFMRVEKWLFDTPDVPGETFRQLIKDCYQNNLLIKNRMEVGGRRVDMKNITMPLLNIFAQEDHLVKPAACEPLIAAVASRDAENRCLDTGHLGIFLSADGQEALAQEIARWLSERDAGPGPRSKRLCREAPKTVGLKGNKKRVAKGSKPAARGPGKPKGGTGASKTGAGR